MWDYAKKFVNEYRNPNIEQKVIDAIVVDFINFYASKYLCVGVVSHTKNLRKEKNKIGFWGDLDKEFVQNILDFHKKEYNNFGIVKSVNLHSYMNECDGKAVVENADALDVVEELIKGYINECATS